MSAETDGEFLERLERINLRSTYAIPGEELNRLRELARKGVEAETDKERMDWLDKLPTRKVEQKIIHQDGHYITWTVRESGKDPHTARTLRAAIDRARVP